MTVGNGNKVAGMWIAIVISATGLGSTVTYALTKAVLDTTNERLTKIENFMESIDDKIESKIGKIDTELRGRVERANSEHATYDKRLDRIETKVGIVR